MELNILLDIETVLDTRMGRLVELYPDIKDQLLFKFPQYCNRDHDNFWLLFPEVEKDTYLNAKVSEETLKLSPRTNIFNVIDDVLRSTQSDPNDPPVLRLHFCPMDFKLNKKAIEAFLVLISARFEHTIEVVHLDKTLETLTVTYLNDNMDLVILYDFNRWTDLHSEELKQTKLDKVVFYLPTLFTDKLDADKHFFDLMKTSGVEGEPLEILTEYFRLHYQLNIHFIANKYFSPITTSHIFT